MKTSTSPAAVAAEAYALAKASIGAHTHKNAPKKFTRHQLFACLVLREFYDTTYRGIVGILADSAEVRAAIDLDVVPHYTTLQKQAAKLLAQSRTKKLITRSVVTAKARGLVKDRPDQVAFDGSGFEATTRSAYYAKRRQKTAKDGSSEPVRMRRFPKLGMSVDTASHFVVTAEASRGPSPDFGDFDPLLTGTLAVVYPKQVSADAGYSSEENHELCRDEFDIQSLMPSANGRPSEKEPSGRYRRAMKRYLHLSNYGRRW